MPTHVLIAILALLILACAAGIALQMANARATKLEPRFHALVAKGSDIGIAIRCRRCDVLGVIAEPDEKLVALYFVPGDARTILHKEVPRTWRNIAAGRNSHFLLGCNLAERGKFEPPDLRALPADSPFRQIPMR